jgi:serine/threonine protein kinase
MAFLHAQAVPVFHRDLRCSNILVVDLSALARPAVKIADLGSSCRSLGKVSGRVVHNPRWKPPELFAGADYTAAADVYCFALIMWELVGRANPFKELTWPSLIEHRILLGERPAMSGLDDVPPAYLALMVRSWAQTPSERPTFADIVSALGPLNL